MLLAFANFFIDTAQSSIAEHGKFNVVLSGGNSPKKLYELLASSLYNKKMDWKKLFFFFGDERCVPQDDSENNARMVHQALFDPLHISSNQIFKIDTSLQPPEAAAKYMDVIEAHFTGRQPRFDLIVLGLGENAHTASLFPNNEVLVETSGTIKEVFLQDENRFRITMTAPLINEGHHLAFLVYGKNKSKAVRHVLKDKTDIQKYPAQLIRPVHGDLQWFLDEGAAPDLRCPLKI